MTGVAILLVLFSAVAHASWNLLAKRATTPEVSTWWMAAASSVLLLPWAIYLLIVDFPPPIGWAFIGSTIGLHVLYFISLGRAYRFGDLSTVYPVARGLGLMLIPILGVLVLRESMSWQAMLGAGLVFAGIFGVGFGSGDGLPRRFDLRGLLSNKGLLFALATGVVIGCYSVLDKRGVSHVAPVLYMYMLQAGGGAGMLAFLSREYRYGAFRSELAIHWRAVVAGGLLQFAAYALVLSALRLSPVSYVGPFRELGIVLGIVMGAVILRERVTRLRIAGAVAITAGAMAIAFAP